MTFLELHLPNKPFLARLSKELHVPGLSLLRGLYCLQLTVQSTFLRFKQRFDTELSGR